MTNQPQKEAGLLKAFPSLKELCARYQIRFKKALGQNLLLDENINGIMVEAADLSEKDAVIEVGAGLGAPKMLAARSDRDCSSSLVAPMSP